MVSGPQLRAPYSIRTANFLSLILNSLILYSRVNRGLHLHTHFASMLDAVSLHHRPG